MTTTTKAIVFCVCALGFALTGCCFNERTHRKALEPLRLPEPLVKVHIAAFRWVFGPLALLFFAMALVIVLSS